MMGCFLRTLCIFRARGISRTLPNIYDGRLHSKPCVTPAYLEPWHIQNPSHIQNTAKHISRNILFKTLCNPDIFRNLVYSEHWYILKSKHIQNPSEYLRWSILLRTLQRPCIFKTLAYSEPVFVSYSLMYQLFFRTTNVLLYLLMKI